MLKHLLVPLDESELSERALEYARKLLAPGGKITVITAVPDNPLPGSRYTAKEVDDIRTGMVEHADAYLERIAQSLKSDNILTERIVANGKPEDAIIDTANRLNVDAVVMSTHGRSGISRWVLGSVTQKVLGTLLRPVFVVPDPERPK